MSETVATGLGAVFFSAAAYGGFRWRHHLALAAVAWRRGLASRLPSRLQWLLPRYSLSERWVVGEAVAGAVLALALAALMWVAFIGSLVCDLRGLP